MRNKICTLLIVAIAAVHSVGAQDVSSKTLLERAKAASVIILTGEGAGRLRSIGTGVIVSSDGVILTALHVVKDASEVQVRTANGDVFDHVQLLGTDERRDVAALKIAARSLPYLEAEASKQSSTGDPVYAVTSANGLEWSATSGMVSALRSSDEVPAAGAGYKLIQFTAPVAPGASGGGVISSDGKLIGIITKGAVGGTAFAVPINSVIGLSEGGRPTQLGSGALLQTPQKQAAEIPASSTAIASTDPKQVLKNAKTLYLTSKTSFLTIDTLQRALLARKDWSDLGLTIVQDPRLGDLMITVDRPLFTYVHTFVLSDRRTTIVLGAGKQTAFDGTIASDGLAKDIVKILAAARLPAKATK